MPSTITIMPPPRPTDAAPAYTALAVTPSDAVGFAACRGLYVGADGDITAVMVGAQTPVLFAAARAGTVLPIAVTQVLETGTTATDIVALY